MVEEQILSKIIDIIVKFLNPKSILLFGSRVKGSNSDGADFDIAVDCKMPDIRTERMIRDEIEKISRLFKVDIIYLENVDKEFKNIISKKNKIIYARRT